MEGSRKVLKVPRWCRPDVRFKKVPEVRGGLVARCKVPQCFQQGPGSTRVLHEDCGMVRALQRALHAVGDIT